MTKQFSKLTDSQWAAISPFFDLNRKRKHDLRQIINIILWILRTGCQWRNLPEEWPNWQAVYYYFERWKQDGTFERINVALNQRDRKRVKKEAYPSILSIDTQSIKLNPMICEYRGTDANKRVNGRKRQFALTGIYYKRKKDSQWHRQMVDDDKLVSLRNVRSGVVEIDTGDVGPDSGDASSFLGFADNIIQPKPATPPERNKIRAKVKELYRDLYEGDIETEDDPDPFTTEEYADYVFKSYCGICLGIFDYDRMSIQEIDDTLVPLVDSKTENSFLVIHRGGLAMFGHDDNVMETFWSTLGTNPYLLIPSAVLAHNDFVARDAESKLDKLLKDLRQGRSRSSVRQLNLERNHVDKLLNNDILGNVFQYKTEQEIYVQGMKRRGIDERIKDAQSKLEQLEKLINEKQETASTRYQRRITLLGSLVGVFGSYQIVHDYFDELAVSKTGKDTKESDKKVAYDNIPILLKGPADGIDSITEYIGLTPWILPNKQTNSSYSPFYLSLTSIAFFLIMFFGIKLLVDLLNPGRNKKLL